VLPNLLRGGILKGAMETRIRPGAVAGFGCLIRVKMTQVAADPTSPGHITVQIFVFRDNPLKYTDPDENATVNNRSGDDVYAMYEKAIEDESGEILPSQNKDKNIAGKFSGSIDGAIAQDGTIYKGMGSVTITKDEGGKYHFKVSFFGKLINWIANKIKEMQDRNKSSNEKRDPYKMYHKDDGSITADSWWPTAKHLIRTQCQITRMNTKVNNMLCKGIYGLLFCMLFQLSSCVSIWDVADKIKSELEENSKVLNICYVKLRPGFDHTLTVSFELENRRRLILYVHQSFKITYIVEIDKYRGEGRTLVRNEQYSRHGSYNGISPRVLEIKLRKSLRTMNEIIDSYDEILAFVEKVYQEPPVPDNWDNEDDLERYSGYTIINDNRKSKLYIFPIDQNQE
jgi:hypothetical protein